MKALSSYRVQAILLLSMGLLANPFIQSFLLGQPRLEIARPFLWGLTLLGAITAVIVILSKKNISQLAHHSLLFSLFLFLGAFFLYAESNLIFYAKLKLLRNIWVVSLWLMAAWMLQTHIVAKRTQINQWILRVSLMVFGLFTLFSVAEIALAWPARTHAYTRTFANNTWFLRYAPPASSENRAIPNGKRAILMLGDSFLAGPGIEDPNDRFSNYVEAQLGDPYFVENTGVGGNDVLDAIETFENTPYTPDYVVFCWTPNDILGAADTLEEAFGRRFSYADLGIGGWFNERLYSLNYIYWSFSHNDFPEFLPKLKALYEDEDLLRIHLDQIDRLRMLCNRHPAGPIPFYLMAFPYPSGKAQTEFATRAIRAHFAEKLGDYFIDIERALADIPADELIVNINDGHPNELANKIAGEAILKAFARTWEDASLPVR